MTIFNYDDYKQFVRDRISNLPKKGRGQYKVLAERLRVHNVFLSQVFSGEKDLSEEQALELSEYLELSEFETDFFILLVQIRRASTHKLQQRLKNRLNLLRQQSQDLRKRLPQDKQLTEEVRALFYSNWYFSGVRLATSLEKLNTVEEIAEYLNLPRTLVQQINEFLLRHGLILQTKKGLEMGPRRIHVGRESLVLSRHHTNWRLKAIETLPIYDPTNQLFFTGPYALSKKAAKKIHGLLLELIDQATAEAVNSESETMVCLNIDWFQI